MPQEHHLHRREGAVNIIDEYIRRSEGVIEKELWQEFVHALHIIAPESKYAKKNEEDDPLTNG